MSNFTATAAALLVKDSDAVVPATAKAGEFALVLRNYRDADVVAMVLPDAGKDSQLTASQIAHGYAAAVYYVDGDVRVQLDTLRFRVDGPDGRIHAEFLLRPIVAA